MIKRLNHNQSLYLYKGAGKRGVLRPRRKKKRKRSYTRLHPYRLSLCYLQCCESNCQLTLPRLAAMMNSVLQQNVRQMDRRLRGHASCVGRSSTCGCLYCIIYIWYSQVNVNSFSNLQQNPRQAKEGQLRTLQKQKSTLCLLDCQHQDERLPQSNPRRRNPCLVLNAPFFLRVVGWPNTLNRPCQAFSQAPQLSLQPRRSQKKQEGAPLLISHSSKEVEPLLERMDRPNQPTRSSNVCLLSAVKPMVRIGHIGDLQLGIYTNNQKTRGKTPFIMVYGALIPRSPASASLTSWIIFRTSHAVGRLSGDN